MGTWDPFATAARILDCVCSTLKDSDRGTQVWKGSCCVWPGAQVALDECCKDGGQLSIVLVNGYPSKRFPAQDATPTTCPGTLAAVYQLQVTRCVADAVQDCDQKEKDASLIMADLVAMIRGINCCFRDEDTCGEFVLNSFKTFGPEGGCSGSIVDITVQESYPCCPGGG